MKFLIAFVLFGPALAMAQPKSASPSAEQPATACRFSAQLGEHNEVMTRGCSKKLCHHVVVCGKTLRTVICEAKNGSCDGYDANDCIARATSEDAEFDTAPRK